MSVVDIFVMHVMQVNLMNLRYCVEIIDTLTPLQLISFQKTYQVLPTPCSVQRWEAGEGSQKNVKKDAEKY